MTTANKVKFILGRAKSGKTHEILQAISENEKRGERSLLIVPSGATFEYEKRLAKVCLGGFMHTKICGFFRLGELVLNEAGLSNAFITEQGRIMVIRRAVEEAELSVFHGAAKQAGFALMCDEIISNFVTCELTSDDILTAAQKNPEGSVLRGKLQDLASIYAITEKYLNETGQELRAACDTICENIPKTRFCDAHVYVDGIDNPGEQTYRMFEALLSAAKSVTVALCADTSAKINAFARNERIYARLRSIVSDNGYGAETVRLERQDRYKSRVLDEIERKLWNFPVEKFAKDSSCIELYAAPGIRQEVEALAEAVLEKSRQGARFRNMAVVAADTEKYDVLIKSIFAEFSIPVFTDNKLKLSSTAPARLINAALNCVCNGYRAHDVIRLMKTGLCGISRDETERLENYILATGISGSDLLEPFKFGKIPETAEDTRKRVITPLREMQSKMAHGNTYKKADALMDYLKWLEVDKKTESMAEKFISEGKLVLAKQYSQVWPLICEVIDQLKSVMGDSKMTAEKLSDIIEEGLSADIIGVIPAGVDMLFYGDMSQTLPDDIDNLFIVGACVGDFPTVRKDDNVIDDSELEKLKSDGLNVWLSVESKREQDEATIYSLLTKPNETLYMSYPVSVNDESREPAFILKKLCAILDRQCDTDTKYKLCSYETMAKSLRYIADDVELTDREKAFVAWNMQKEEKKQAMQPLLDAMFFEPSPLPLERSIAERLYNNRVYGTATRIEDFSACPFRHFMNYGMKAVPRKTFTMAKADEGSFCHEVIDAFVRYVVDNNINYKSLTDAECDSITEAVAEGVAENFAGGIFSRSERQRIRLQSLTEIAKDTVRAIVYHMQKGKFEFYGSEVVFGMGEDSVFPPIQIALHGGKTLSISGKIDRIDSYRDLSGTVNLRVVDYKTSGMDMDFKKLYEGLSIQLPLYLEAATVHDDSVVGCGMYYMPMQKGHADVDTVDKLKEKIIAQFKLKGIMLDDEEISIATSGDVKKSDVVKSGKVNADTNTAMPREKLYAVKRFAMQKAKSAAERILGGDISASPCDLGEKDMKGNKKTSCMYCKMKGVCMFDETLSGCAYRKLRNPDFDEIFGTKPID